MIKNAANEGIVSRFFATGVSPMTIDAMTSGFNITSSITLELDFHDLMGFRAAEVEDILLQVGATRDDLPRLMTDLKEWYDGYLFHEAAPERLYNSDMIMYFASHYERRQQYPRKMLDSNIATDYTKVKKVFNIQQREAEFIPVLKRLTTEGALSSEITEFFNLERPFTEGGLISLLFYMGWITIERESNGLYTFFIPNRVIKELYHEYFVDITQRQYGLNSLVYAVQGALAKLAQNNDPHPFLEVIKILINKVLSLRDARGFAEKHLKMLLIPYLSLSTAHYVASEPEWENRYPDILLLKRPNIETQYNFIIELKYVKKADAKKRNEDTKELIVEKVKREARTQIQQYLQTENARRIADLKAWVIVLVGREWQAEEVVVSL